MLTISLIFVLLEFSKFYIYGNYTINLPLFSSVFQILLTLKNVLIKRIFIIFQAIYLFHKQIQRSENNA